MILLKRNQQGIAVVTASEKAVLNPTQFTLSFIHDLTKKEVLIDNAADESQYPERFNRFIIDISLFDDLDNGFFTYRVTDQAGNLLEVGKMKLVDSKTDPIQYQDTPTEYETYGK